jgi:cell division protein FtsZ
LLEDVSLESAAGVIANFTGGEDLSLFEVQAALESLRARTGPQTDVVLGVINDAQMQRRAQVILMVTGLGAPTLEEAMAEVRGAAQDLTPPMPEPAPEPEMADQKPVGLSMAVTGQDLPAFMRYRSRYRSRHLGRADGG